jgi:hypothetical protein
MGWKKLSYRSRGIAFGAILGLVLSSLAVYLLHYGMKCAFGLPGEFHCGLEAIEMFYIILIGTIAVTILGLIVGFIVGKIKN